MLEKDDSIIFIQQVNLGSSYLNAGEEMERMGSEHASIVPYQTFRQVQ